MRIEEVTFRLLNSAMRLRELTRIADLGIAGILAIKYWLARQVGQTYKPPYNEYRTHAVKPLKYRVSARIHAWCWPPLASPLVT